MGGDQRNKHEEVLLFITKPRMVRISISDYKMLITLDPSKIIINLETTNCLLVYFSLSDCDFNQIVVKS